MRTRNRPTRLPLLLLALLAGLPACGDGHWGAEITLTLSTTDASDLALQPGATLAIAPDTTLVVERACLNVETVVVSPVADTGSDSAGDDACFCHGDPPHCHGICDTAAGATTAPLIRSVQRGLDLLAGAAPLVTGGVAPGAYDRVVLSLSQAPAATADLPPACADLPGHTFRLEGTLYRPGRGAPEPLTIDLQVADRITEVLQAATPAEATAAGGTLGLRLRLDAALGAVDWSRVLPDAAGRVTVGGPLQSNIIAVGELLGGLTAASSWVAAPGEAP